LFRTSLKPRLENLEWIATNVLPLYETVSTTDDACVLTNAKNPKDRHYVDIQASTALAARCGETKGVASEASTNTVQCLCLGFG
jgi:hypothetical protein